MILLRRFPAYFELMVRRRRYGQGVVRRRKAGVSKAIRRFQRYARQRRVR